MPNSLLKKYKSLYSSTANSFATGTGVTITPASVVGLPTDTEIALTFDRVNSSGVSTPTVMERIVGSISGGNLAIRTTDPVTGGVLSGRGFDSSTEQSHTSPVVEHIWNAGDWNDLVTHSTTEHNQDGSHKQITNLTNNTPITMKDVGGTKRALNNLNTNNVQELGVAGTSAINDQYLVDGGAANAYTVTCVPAPIAYAAGMKLRFKAANANTTVSTLNVNGLGVKTIKRYGTTDLSSGDILAGQIVEVIYDGTNFLLTGSTVFGSANDSWISIPTTLSYSTVDGHTFVVTTNSVDLTASIGVGDRVKFTNNATTFNGIVTAINATTITLYGGTTYSVANSAITNPFYSHAKVPVGFNPDPLIWTESLTDNLDRIQSSPVTTTWYNPGSLSLAVPIGAWRLSYMVAAQSASTGYFNVTLSNANNSSNDNDFTSLQAINTAGTHIAPHTREKGVKLAAKTTYYLLANAQNASTSIGFVGTYAPSRIQAVCAYL